MKAPASTRCAHCGAEISPAASVCGFCQKPVGMTWLLRPVLAGLLAGAVLGLLIGGALWLRAALRRAAAQEQAPAAAVSADLAARDAEYAAMLTEAEREEARGDHRLAISWLMRALASRPERPEARSRLEALRVELMKNRKDVMSMNPPLMTPPAPAAAAAGPSADLAAIPGGSFTMGSTDPGGSPDEYPAHEVTLSSFSIEAHEVTVEAYRKFCADTKRKLPAQPDWSSPRHPVVSVTWRDAQDYCRHQGGRLPTEAEWERAARCGNTQRYLNGGSVPAVEQYVWFAGNSSEQAHPVGMKLRGNCGVSDAYGNVWEWVSDWYSGNYYDNSPKKNPPGPRSGEEKVLRGGAFDSPSEALTATFRDKFSPEHGAENRGFRCVLP